MPEAPPANTWVDVISSIARRLYFDTGGWRLYVETQHGEFWVYEGFQLSDWLQITSAGVRKGEVLTRGHVARSGRPLGSEELRVLATALPNWA